MTIFQPITLETRLPRSTTEDNLRALDAYAETFSRASRHYFSSFSKGSTPNKPQFMVEHGLTGRQFNAVKVGIEGMVKSQLSNLPGYKSQADQKAEGLKRRLSDNRTSALLLDAQGKQKAAQKLWRSLPGFQERIQRLLMQSSKLTQQIKSKSVSICFGSKRLFNAQHHLEKNGFTDHEAWKNEWQRSRSSQFFVLGSSDEISGCQGCTLLPDADGGWILRLRMPEGLIETHGKYLYLDGVYFPYYGAVIEQAVARQHLRSERKAEYVKGRKSGEIDPDIKESAYLENLGQALSYRFVRDRKGWRILVSTSVPFEQKAPDFSIGCIGIDFNAGFVSVAELDASGAKVVLNDLSYDRLQATSRQNKTAMQALAIKVVTQAKLLGKPVVIESLDFARKKGALQKNQTGQASYNRMLSQLSYQQFRTTLNMQCLKQGVALVQVNPAYTSLLGKLKYHRETEFNTHQAAAWVIGRRGMKLKERVPRSSPCRVKQETLTYRAPVDARQGEQRLPKLAKHYATWISNAWKAARVRGDIPVVPAACRMIPF
jgi:IS605 OrfB family transposase